MMRQDQSLQEQRALMEAKNEEFTAAISYAKQVEESLKIEREINAFAVQTKYELVSLLSVSTRTLTVYQKSKPFEKAGLQSSSDYDSAAALVSDNLVFPEDRAAFRRIFLDHLVAELAHAPEFVLEYRLLHADEGIYRWKRVLYRYFRNSKDVIIQLGEDIHKDICNQMELAAKNEKLILNEKCFKALSEQTNKVILEWDFDTDGITAISSFGALFGQGGSSASSPQDTLSMQSVHPNDRLTFSEVVETLRRGDAVEDSRFRIVDSVGRYHRCSFSALVITDKQGKPFKAIGSLESIEAQLNREALLRQRAETDQLTGLYNKAATESLVKELLTGTTPDRPFALLLIDVDNFKSINDNLGHLYGDMVLAELAEDLRALFRSIDLVGRVGGDEFFVLLSDFRDGQLLLNKANDICKTFRKRYSSGQISVKISASIGISLYPKDGADFETLFKCADLALYDTKAKGKNGFTFFEGQRDRRYQGGRTEIDSRGGPQKSFKENRVEYIFKLLYESENEGGNIEGTLQFVTERFHFSRGYIFEIDSSGNLISNTFEWCAANVSAQKAQLQNMSIDFPCASLGALKENGFVLIEDISRLECQERAFFVAQDIKSMVQFCMLDKGDPIGFIGFDDCTNKRSLTRDEIEELKLICHVLSTFLSKQRAMEQAEKNLLAMLAILNSFEGYAYVVDGGSYEILFENENVRKLKGCSGVGKRCYEQYMNQQAPCAACPIRGLSEQVLRHTEEIYHESWGIFSRSTASHLDWTNDKQNYLISSIDISGYKK